MRKIFITFTLAVCTIFNSWSQKVIRVKNNTGYQRSEVISTPFDKFSKHFGVDTIFTIKDKEGKIYTHQIEKLGTNSPQNVLILVDISKEATLDLIVSKEASKPYATKTYARYIPERFDDFAWENDLVAFRYYGKALEGRGDDAQGIDIWVKKTVQPIVNKWYTHGDYHTDHGEGLDYYAVGQTLGVGDIAPYLDNQVKFTKHYRKSEILDNGPIRTTFLLTYEPEDILGNTISLTKKVTLDAGSQLNKTVVKLNNSKTNKTPIVIGIAKRNEAKPAFDFDKETNSLSYWEPQMGNNGITGTGVIIPKVKLGFIDSDSKQFLLKTSIKNDKPFTYFNGGSWSKAGKITSAETWENYIEEYAEKLQKPLKIKLK